MSYLSTALTRMAEQKRLTQSDIARASGLSRGFLSRLFSGESGALSDDNFAALLPAFAPDRHAQAEIIAARCRDAKAGVADTPGADLVEISIKKTSGGHDSPLNSQPSSNDSSVELSAETERAFAWLRSQCPLNPELEKHLVGYARLTGMR